MADIDDKVHAEGEAFLHVLTGDPELRDASIDRVVKQMIFEDPEAVTNALAAIRLFAKLMLLDYGVSDDVRDFLLKELDTMTERMRH